MSALAVNGVVSHMASHYAATTTACGAVLAGAVRRPLRARPTWRSDRSMLQTEQLSETEVLELTGRYFAAPHDASARAASMIFEDSIVPLADSVTS